jgi:hypothetical protein
MLIRNRFLGGMSRLALLAPETGSETAAPAAPAAPADFTPTLPADTGPINVRDATKIIADAREKAQKAAQEPEKPVTPRATNGQFAKQEEIPSQEGDAAPPQEVTGETQEADPADEPLLELPRSWNKDKAEFWQKLDRPTQEYLLEQDKTASAEIRRVQNEAAEKTKALTAKEQAADTARQQYEAAAQRNLQFLQGEMSRDFGDIKSIADVQKLATDDPFRFAQFQARQMQIQAQAKEVENLERQRAEEASNKFDTWSKEQDEKFTKQFPEFADKEKSAKVREGIVTYLTKEVGVPEEQLPKLWNEHLFRDAMFQRVVYDASRFHAAQQKAKAAVAVPKPAPQRPGSAPNKGAQVQDQIAGLQAKLKTSKGIEAAKTAAELMRLQRAARR